MKKQSLAQKLFRTYAGWFLLCLFVTMCISVWYAASVISKNNAQTQQQLMKSMDENVENYFEEMDDFSRELLNSEEFKEVSIKKLPAAFEEKISSSQLFSALYNEAYQMIQKDYKVGVVTDNLYYIWMGNGYFIEKIKGDPITVYDTMVRDEKPVVKYLNRNEYLVNCGSERYQEEKEQEYITLSRSMDRTGKYLNGRAILEILVEAGEFKESMNRLSGNTGGQGLQLNIFDGDQKALYQESSLELSGYLNQPTNQVYHHNGNLIQIHKVFDDRITIVYTIDKATYYNGLLSFLGIALLIGLAVFGLITWITYGISQQISKPIHHMCQKVEQINLESGILYEEERIDIHELSFLSHTLRSMSVELEQSLKHMIALKDYETHARMLALQSQMQPHFLFNTLTTIGTMAETQGNEKVVRMCTNLTQMFRYIAAGESMGVQLFEEIRQVNCYVEIMKERFPSSDVRIDIPLEMMDCTIPKLTIQPLVENSFKYCNRQKPEISVSGKLLDEERWEIAVEDNGTGFSEEKRMEILEKCRNSLTEERNLLLQIDGMGLVNVYVRLKLFYGEGMTYEIEAGKGRIIIGGTRKKQVKQP